MVMSPNGDVLPCQIAASIPALTFANVQDYSLDWIWYESEVFNRFRGTEWMDEPCRTCPRQTIDFGGCRCQAFLLTGSATATDPVCHLSPDNHLILQAQVQGKQTISTTFTYRSVN
jgi:pyrroloquinoline quinone biosynthesis protein E